MRINEVKIYPISLPFLDEFSHSIRKRSSANNIVVEVIADRGELKGYGEGAPRSYVTGESQESTPRSIKSMLEKDSFPRELNDVSQVWNFLDHLPDGKEHNSAICALEMALLDLLGKVKNRSIIEYFPQDYLTEQVTYGVALPLVDKKRIREMALRVKDMGIKRLKLKMGKDYHENQDIVETVRQVFGLTSDLKVDVNGVWDRDLAFGHIPLIKDYRIKVVEQPMMPDNPDIAEFAKRMRENHLKIMADESACSFKDVVHIGENRHYNMINVRLSKCGGFRRSFRIIRYLREKGVHFQIACQLGESGLLSAAGRILSLLCSDALYHDGSYDEFLLQENVTVENVSFGYGGSAGPLEGNGLGVRINTKNLERLNNGKIIEIRVQ
jgi:L-alanine-DL-glutamate epimerase-like enolase superfamily enzyme